MGTIHTERTVSDRVLPVGPENIFRSKDHFQWCSSVLRGEDGQYHLFYSRWKRSYSFDAWLTHSTVAHAVAPRPEGPYQYVGTVLDFEKEEYLPKEKITAHNPKIECFDGVYYLYFCSTHADRKMGNDELIETGRTGAKHANWKMLRENQRTFVATARSLNGPFTVCQTPLLEPSGPITTLAVNPAVTRGRDGRYYLIVKGDKPGTVRFERNQAIAVSTKPDSGFVLQDRPVIHEWDSEDMSLWYDRHTDLYYAVFHAHTYIGMMVSNDGLTWRKAQDFEVLPKRVPLQDGSAILPARLERPFVFTQDGEPQCLSLAVMQQDGDAYIVFVPLKH